jgi:ArsR family metal-binding transcriptional regulator
MDITKNKFWIFGESLLTFAKLMPNMNQRDLSKNLLILKRYEKTLTRHNLNYCNIAGYDREKKIKNTVKKVKKIIDTFTAENSGIKFEIKTNPMGHAIRFTLPNDEKGYKVYNQFDGETWALNW